MKFLESIRSKPIHVRKRILFVSTGAIFFLIVTIWWNTWSIAGTGATATASTLQDKSPVDTIASMWGETKNDVAGTWSEMMQDVEYAANENAPAPDGTPVDANGDAPVYPEDVFTTHEYGTTTESEASTTIN